LRLWLAIADISTSVNLALQPRQARIGETLVESGPFKVLNYEVNWMPSAAEAAAWEDTVTCTVVTPSHSPRHCAMLGNQISRLASIGVTLSVSRECLLGDNKNRSINDRKWDCGQLAPTAHRSQLASSLGRDSKRRGPAF
jgi:hypothetical protein